MNHAAASVEEPSFEARVAAGLARLAERAPVSAPGAFDPQRPERQPARGRRLSAVLVAAAVGIVTVAGLAALANRSASPAPADVPPAPSITAPSEAVDVAEAVEMAPGRALVPDRLPMALANATITAGGRLEAIDDVDEYSSGLVRRWYTSSLTDPEPGAWIAVDAMGAELMEPFAAEGAVQVTVQGVVGEVYDDVWQAVRSLAFTIDGTTYVLSGDNVDDADLIKAGEHLRPSADGYGAVIEPNGLPDGVVERAAGTVFESWFISRESLSAPSPMLRVDEHPVQVWMEARREPAELLSLHRLGHASVTDVTVHGQPAFLTTLTVQPEYRGVTWHEEGVTYQLGSNHLSDAVVLELAEGLRPATLSEWDELVAATERRETDTVNEPPPTIAVVAETSQAP